MGRPSNTNERKQEIATALLRVMAQQGYEKASIQAIAKEAGLAPGLIHYHFKTKQDILISAVNWIVRSAEGRLAKLQQEKQSPWEKLEAFINARLAIGDTQMPEVVSAWVVIAAESIRQPEVREIYQGLIQTQQDMIAALLVDVWAVKTEVDEEVLHLSAIVIAAIEGAFQLSVTAPQAMPKNYAANSLINLIKAQVSN
ncbi:TetR/AcrR family transcriptional regulator [Glaciecola sp. MH2013]|uniref:TetR/AcrR family transcriptional regulator n=1 Tax=Glaciecola sp. MH2013 TaxID=2785524 RepID=UPI0018A0BD8A|nr:TetR/AcrR family transcriptional regulator [Glaciecola sp. MH2013]MBF7074192.1 TetR/AcrR family transcriptional regulator [Glaciecola sp. MH2013]